MIACAINQTSMIFSPVSRHQLPLLSYSAAKERKWERAGRFSAQGSVFRLDFRPHGAPSRSARRIGGRLGAGVSASWERLGPSPPPRSARRPPNARHRALSSVFLTQARKRRPRLCCSAVTPSPQEAGMVPKSPKTQPAPLPLCVCAAPAFQ